MEGDGGSGQGQELTGTNGSATGVTSGVSLVTAAPAGLRPASFPRPASSHPPPHLQVTEIRQGFDSSYARERYSWTHALSRLCGFSTVIGRDYGPVRVRLKRDYHLVLLFRGVILRLLFWSTLNHLQPTYSFCPALALNLLISHPGERMSSLHPGSPGQEGMQCCLMMFNAALRINGGDFFALREVMQQTPYCLGLFHTQH